MRTIRKHLRTERKIAAPLRDQTGLSTKAEIVASAGLGTSAFQARVGLLAATDTGARKLTPVKSAIYKFKFKRLESTALTKMLVVGRRRQLTSRDQGFPQPAWAKEPFIRGSVVDEKNNLPRNVVA